MLSPIDELITTYEEALAARDASSRFCVLTTVDASGCPVSRVLTVRSIGQDGVRLYVDRCSPKIIQLEENSHFELLFFWPNLMKQFKVRGEFEVVKDKQQAVEWRNKPYAGRLVDLYHSVERAQSSVVDSLQTIRSEVTALAENNTEQQLTEMPDELITLQIKPNYISAWINVQQDRIHDRREYNLVNGTWHQTVLVP